MELLEENIKRCCHSLGDVKSRLDQLTNENEILTQKYANLKQVRKNLRIKDTVGPASLSFVQ